jgi:hypothetical protein
MFSLAGYADPLCSNPTNITPTSYDPNFPSTFNVTCTNASTAFITIYNSTGGFLISNSMTNITPTNYNYSIILPAGTWTWNSNASDSENNWNSTGNITIMINNGTMPLHLYLNGTESNKTNFNGYKFNDIANFSVFLDTGSVLLGDNTTYLYSNFTPWDVQNSSNYTFFNYSINLSSTGLFYLTANCTGDSNYSASSQTYLFTVTDLSWLSNNTSVSSGSQYVSGNNYTFQINWTGNVSKVLFEWNGDNSSYSVNNTNNTYWVNLTDLPVGNYNYSWYANDTNNVWSRSDFWNYNITSIPITLSFSADPAIVAPSGSVTFSCSNTTPVANNLSLSLSGPTGACSGNYSFSCTVSVPSTENSYTYSCIIGNTNYSGNVYQYKTILVQNPSGTTTTSTTSTTTTTSTGTFSVKDLASSLSMNAGESKPITFQISNGLSNNLLNVSVSVSGIDSSWYTLSKNTISNLIHGSSETITLTLKIPASADAKTYGITVTAKGTFLGSTTIRTATGSMNIIVNNSTQNVIAPSLGASNENTTSNETQNTTSEQPVGPTGLTSIFEYLRNNLLIIVAIAACVLIFIFRDDVNENLAKITGRKTMSIDFSSIKSKINNKLPDFGKIKRGVRDLRPEKPGIKRPEVLEREIKRDIKELQNVIDTEKKLNKKKKSDIENN